MANKKIIDLGGSVNRLFSPLLAVSLVILLTGCTAISQQLDVSAGGFANCRELNKAFKNGVSSLAEPVNAGSESILQPTFDAPAYSENRDLDEDADGIACEVINEAPFVETWSAIAQPLESCQIKETKNFFGGGKKGFPPSSWNAALGKVRIAVIPVDFPNAIGDEPSSSYLEDVKLMKDWADHFSRGKMTYDIEFHGDSWIRAPKGAEWYRCEQCKGSKKELQPKAKAAQELVAAADTTYDFANVEMIYFIFPAQAEVEFGTTAYGFDVPLKTSEGAISASVYGELGGVINARPEDPSIWDHAIHELLHFQGFIGHGPKNGSGYYITTNQWGESKAVTSWEGFLNGWYGDDEILCLDTRALEPDQEAVVTMDSLDNFGADKESVIVRLSEEEVVVVERRESGPFTTTCSDCFIPAPVEEGFIAYRVNVNLAPYRDDNDPNSDSKNFWSFLGSSSRPVLQEAITYKQISIEPVSEKQVKIKLVDK